MSAQAIGLGNGRHILYEAPTGRPYLAHARSAIAMFLSHEIRAAPLGLLIRVMRFPRAALRLPWADIGLPRLGRENICLWDPADTDRVQRQGTTTSRLTLRVTVNFGTGETHHDSMTIDVLQRSADPEIDARIAVFDPEGETRRLLDDMGVRYLAVSAGDDLSPFDMLVVGKQALTLDGTAPRITRVRDGLKVVAFEQTAAVLEQRLGFRVAEYGLRWVFPRVPDHPILSGLGEQHLRNWRGAATLVPPRLEYKLDPQFNYAPATRWCGIPVSRLWRCGSRGSVASVLIEKPPCGDFLPITDGGYSLQYSPLLEYREGEGLVLFCQMDVTGRAESDPAARTLARNVIEYVASWKPAPRRAVVYAGDPAGKRHLQSAGVSPLVYETGELSDDRVLVVGPGGARQLSDDAEDIADWLKTGGHLLALGLDPQEVSALLPMKVEMKVDEHIATWFKPFGTDSLLAGVAPADVHNPAPRELPLLSGSTAVGNGVLGRINNANIVFCQLPPFALGEKPRGTRDAKTSGGRSEASGGRKSPDSPRGLTPEPISGLTPTARLASPPPYPPGQRNLKRTHRRTSFLLARLLANMGAAGSTPLLERFSSPVGIGDEPSAVRNGDFQIDSDTDGMADDWVFTSGSKEATCGRTRVDEGDGGWSLLLSCPSADEDSESSIMLAQHDVPVRKGQWYRISFRARAEDLAAKSVAMTITNMTTWRSLFEYPRFLPDQQWKQFSFEVQSEDTVERGTRFQVWYSGTGRLWLSDIRVQPIADPTQGRWIDGLYLDEPEAWDDPYRFFRW